MFFDSLFPERCLGCGRWGDLVCDMCLQERVVPYPNNDGCLYCGFRGGWLTCETCIAHTRIDGLYSLFTNQLIIKEIIKKYKYGYMKILEPVLKKLVLNSLPVQEIPLLEAIIPVPLSPYRERQRGFNQSLVVAEAYSRVLRVPVCDIMKRRHRFSNQARLKKDERHSNVKGVFYSEDHTFPQKVLIVDDVYTTGRTVHSLACALKEKGVEEVYVSTLARSV